MQAMVLEQIARPLQSRDLPDPVPSAGQLVLEVSACAVCRTDLHVVDGELAHPALPLVPGHEIVGRVLSLGPTTRDWEIGERVGVGWLGWTCGKCEFCLAGKENLCPEARFTGYQLPGGYATRALADGRFCFRLPEGMDDLDAAPLLCAGLIGYRALKAAGEGRHLGLYGFGAAAHLVLQVALHQGRSVFAFTRPGDEASRSFALAMGARWAGGSDQPPPEPLDAAILFAPAGALVPAALAAVKKGGRVICAGIHMSDIPSFPYALLWGERTLASVANLTRQDAQEFLSLAPRIPVRSTVNPYALRDANQALADLRAGRLQGAAVLSIGA
jgi:propanol-preferring alcohol dehydrogenase